MIATLPPSRYPALHLLQIQPNQPPRHHHSQRIAISKGCYTQNQILPKLIDRLRPTQPPHLKATSIITKYFSFSLNPIFQQLSKLPQKIFVCGYCKQPYFDIPEYILHCIEFGCPLNHNRSTYFFNFKDTFLHIQNSDIQQTMTTQEWTYFQKISFRKNTFLFAHYDIKPLRRDSNSFSYCGKCKLKTTYHLSHFVTYFAPHLLFKCKTSQLSTNSHSLHVIQCQQGLIDFVKDIINFAINFNIISLFNDSYVRLEKNPKFQHKGIHTHFCANCDIKFSDQIIYIQHCLFQCAQKTNSCSSHHFKRKILQYKLSTSNISKSKETELIKNEVKIQSSRTLEKQWTQKLNPEFQEFKYLLNNLYFCGQCYTHYESDEQYLFHSLSLKCPINHRNNSYFFLKMGSEQALQMATIESYFEAKRKSQSTQKLDLLNNQWKQRINVIDRFTKLPLKPAKIDNYYCGKCGQKFKTQPKYIQHCLNECFSFKHEKNSHIFHFSRYVQSIQKNSYKQFFLSYLYALQIIKIADGKKFKLTKNQSIDVDPDYLCGKCDTLFGNVYEYLLHSLEVCKSFKSKYSSHFIVSVLLKNDIQKIKWPLNIIFGGDIQHLAWKKNHSANEFEDQNQKIKDKNIKFQENQYKEQEKFNSLQTIREEVQRAEQTRFLRANIQHKAQRKEYSCGQCEVSFKKIQKFQAHLENCKNYECISSSHFFIKNQRYEEINTNRILSSKNNRPLPRKMPKVEAYYYQKFKCGCGQEGSLGKFAFHNLDNHDSDVQQGSSHVIIRIVYDSLQRVFNIYLPVAPTNTHMYENYEYVCPCDPWKSFKYAHFIDHTIKKHQGKSPKFWMRFEGDN